MLSAEQLKRLRLVHGVSQIALGKELGVTKNYISMVENRKEKCSQTFHDRYVNAVYKVAEQKKNEALKSEDLEQIEEVAEETVKKTNTTKKSK